MFSGQKLLFFLLAACVLLIAVAFSLWQYSFGLPHFFENDLLWDAGEQAKGSARVLYLQPRLAHEVLNDAVEGTPFKVERLA